jgi:hypothetical protein
MENKCMKNCSISLDIWEIHVKHTCKFHLTLVRMVIMSKSTIVGEDERKNELYLLLVEM